ncbi:MAG: 3',5'-cyclic-nucleotide phosphodiesterase [Gemmataceae bacterium]
MKIMLVPSSVRKQDNDPLQFVTSFLINDTVAIDAGCLGFFGAADEQARIEHVLISHTHIDHLASLPLLIENAYTGKPDPITLHGSEAVLECLKSDIFNNRVWPDFFTLAPPNAPFLRFELIRPHETVELNGLRITPIPVDHVVPTLGFIVQDQTSSVVFSSDTGPTDEIWQHAHALPNLKGVFLELAFPNSLEWLAKLAKHHCVSSFAQELTKLPTQVPVMAYHLKPRSYAQIVAELQQLGLPNVTVAVPGNVYSF